MKLAFSGRVEARLARFFLKLAADMGRSVRARRRRADVKPRTSEPGREPTEPIVDPAWCAGSLPKIRRRCPRDRIGFAGFPAGLAGLRSVSSGIALACLRRDSLLESDSDVPPHSDALRVLIVDDDALLRWALAETLADSGHVTIQARDAASAIRAMSDQPIDVILLDLPDSGRLTLLSTLRRLAPATAIIVTIDHRTPGVKIPAIRLGAHRVVTKPLEMDQVAALVSHANRCRPI